MPPVFRKNAEKLAALAAAGDATARQRLARFEDVARIVTGTLAMPPPCRPAEAVRGWVLEEMCRAYEFRIESADTSQERGRLEARVVRVHEGRPFIGFNRARHAVVEGAILVTRLHLLGADEVGRRLRELAVLVEKTGGPREHEAFQLLVGRVSA
jgi:hypothetical protein